MRGKIALILMCCLLALSACQSVDFTDDLNQSAQQVRERSGVSPNWQAPYADTQPRWDGKSPLTTEQALMIALENNRQLRADLEAIAAARADLAQAGLLANPVLAMTYRTPVGPDLTSVTDLTLTQVISGLWLRPLRMAEAQATLQQAILSTAHGALELLAQVQTSLAKVRHAQDMMALLEENAALVAKTEQALKLKFDAGTATQLDRERAHIQALDQEAELRDTQAEAAQAKQELLELLGLAGQPTEFVVAPAAPAAALNVDEAHVAELARTRRLDVLAAQWTVQAQVQKLKQENLSVIPEIELGPDFEKADPQAYTVGVAATIPLPLFDQGQARVASAQAELRRQIASAAALQQQAVREARQALSRCRLAGDQLHALETRTMPALERTLSLARTAFDTAAEDLTVLLETQQSINEARIKSADLKRDQAQALAELQRAVGGPAVLAPPTESAPATQP